MGAAGRRRNRLTTPTDPRTVDAMRQDAEDADTADTPESSGA